RILMRQRQFDDVLARIARVSDGLRPQAIREMGTVVGRYYSPDEKVRFAAAIERNPKRIEIPTAAGFAHLQAKWMYERLMASPGAENAAMWKNTLINLQKQRLAFAELGSQMEAYDRAIPAGVQHGNELMEAAESFRAAGDTAAELRVLQREPNRSAFRSGAHT